MKNRKFKMLLHWLVSTLICFACIYLAVFFGGWRLIVSGDPILLEIAVSIIVGFIMWIIFELSRAHESKLNELEKRIEELEKK
ncbi:MAG: hypothetical protein II306_06120 [Clostridia bacterium]|nr:hypothetical protein [Clostridia bacterium]MEE1024376.1 hypothetical protein [Acutalibacteraceae bacterium]